jgi:hypothetical protein
MRILFNYINYIDYIFQHTFNARHFELHKLLYFMQKHFFFWFDILTKYYPVYVYY